MIYTPLMKSTRAPEAVCLINYLFHFHTNFHLLLSSLENLCFLRVKQNDYMTKNQITAHLTRPDPSWCSRWGRL